MENNTNCAYDKLYLNDVMKVHRYLFVLMEQNTEYDTFSMIDSYMRYSNIRHKMDLGNWSALNKSGKQLYNDIPFYNCKKKRKECQQQYDNTILEWMANIYVLLQWKYNISSFSLNLIIPADELYKTYFPLHETSYKNACEKLYNKYLKKD